MVLRDANNPAQQGITKRNDANIDDGTVPLRREVHTSPLSIGRVIGGLFLKKLSVRPRELIFVVVILPSRTCACAFARAASGGWEGWWYGGGELGGWATPPPVGPCFRRNLIPRRPNFGKTQTGLPNCTKTTTLFRLFRVREHTKFFTSIVRKVNIVTRRHNLRIRHQKTETQRALLGFSGGGWRERRGKKTREP